MARQNRVTPLAEIIAHPGRGLFTGNRGCLVNDHGQLSGQRWRSRAWITCVLDYKSIRRTLMQPRRWTELFFLDEAVAFAAGHRPCAECRRAEYNRFRAAWAGAGGPARKAPEMDAMLHAARLTPDRKQRRHDADFAALPDGSFILHRGQPMLVRGTRLYPYSPDGYGPALPRPGGGAVSVLTPAPLIAVLAAGYAPVLHPSCV